MAPELPSSYILVEEGDMRTNWVLAVSLVAVAGCAVNPAPVAVIGADTDTQALGGEWFGEYESHDAERSGRIYFRFDRATGSAMGHVFMERASESGLEPAHEYVDLSSVEIAGHDVVGILAPYWDPRCGCRLQTTFRGTLDGEVIRGTFTSVHRGRTEVDEGDWWALMIPRSRSRPGGA